MVKRVYRPQSSISQKLLTLHILLGVASFSRWPLSLQFFASDVWKSWQTVEAEQLGAGKRSIGSNIPIIVNGVKHLKQGLEDFPDSFPFMQVLNATSITEIDTTYGTHMAPQNTFTYGDWQLTLDNLQPIVEKGTELLEYTNKDESLLCGICDHEISNPQSTATICPSSGCYFVAHVTCLAAAFQHQEVIERAQDVLHDEATPHAPKNYMFPCSGTCPGCQTKINWVDIVKPMSLRTRGDLHGSH